jgi:hypothetical protein
MGDRLRPGVAVFLLAVAFVATLSACESATHVGTPRASSSPRQTVAPTTAAGATVPFALSGIGDRESSFRSGSGIPWTIRWSFDCANLGQTGQFTLAVTDDKGTDRATSGGSGMQGRGTVTNTDSAETFGLKIRSTCRWQISASS